MDEAAAVRGSSKGPWNPGSGTMSSPAYKRPLHSWERGEGGLCRDGTDGAASTRMPGFLVGFTAV